MAGTLAGGHGIPKLQSTLDSTEYTNDMPDNKNGNVKA